MGKKLSFKAVMNTTQIKKQQNAEQETKYMFYYGKNSRHILQCFFKCHDFKL